MLSGCGVSKEELGKESEKESTEPVKSAEPEEYRIAVFRQVVAILPVNDGAAATIGLNGVHSVNRKAV